MLVMRDNKYELHYFGFDFGGNQGSGLQPLSTPKNIDEEELCRVVTTNMRNIGIHYIAELLVDILKDGGEFYSKYDELTERFDCDFILGVVNQGLVGETANPNLENDEL